jgi:tripartite-type tricarboxylate transporter receptor subunit TctC
MNALIAGDVDYMCDQIVSVVPQVRDGTIVALTVATPNRNAALPRVPTAREAGASAFNAGIWQGLRCCVRTPCSF